VTVVMALVGHAILRSFQGSFCTDRSALAALRVHQSALCLLMTSSLPSLSLSLSPSLAPSLSLSLPLSLSFCLSLPPSLAPFFFSLSRLLADHYGQEWVQLRAQLLHPRDFEGAFPLSYARPACWQLDCWAAESMGGPGSIMHAAYAARFASRTFSPWMNENRRR
jgi:hypothetical protein